MDESEIENKGSSSLFSRFRSPAFRRSEVAVLIELIEKHKYVILNKSTNSAANHAKDRAWDRIAKEFNRRGLGLERSIYVLKTKWENLKRSARKYKDVFDNNDDGLRDEVTRTVIRICATENGLSEFDDQKDDNNFDDERADFKSWACDDNSDSVPFAHDSEMQNGGPKKCELPTGFSARDCRVLLKCVREEKSILFSKSPVIKRLEAWKRVANSYNRQSPRKRSAKELNNKFNNMKTMAKKINIKGFFRDTKRKKYEELSDNNMDRKIKSEPIIDCATDLDFDSDDEKVLVHPIDINRGTDNSHLTFMQDPLNNAHSSDSGLGSISDTKDVTRLKMELLNYKMETARLQRKRIEDALRDDAKERELRAVEQSLRLRAARLEVLAAESKLPPLHPALKYTAEESRAQHYICNGQLDIG